MGVGLDQDALDGVEPPTVALHIIGMTAGGKPIDTDIRLRPSEARQIAEALLRRADLLEGAL